MTIEGSLVSTLVVDGPSIALIFSLTEFCKCNPNTKCTLSFPLGQSLGEDEEDATEVGQESKENNDEKMEEENKEAYDGALVDAEYLVDTEH